MMKVKHSILLFFLTACGLCATLQAQDYSLRSFQWNGAERRYIQYVPATYRADRPTAVIFMLHGLGDTITNTFSTSGMQPLADELGWIIITPQALRAQVALGEDSYNFGAMWNAGIKCQFAGQTICLNSEVDDAGFLMALLDSVEQRYSIHPDSVFFTGFSMGGFMSHRMAVEHGDRIAAIAAVSGTLASGMTDSLPKAPVRVMHIHGTSDQIVSYDNAAITMGSLGTFVLGYGAEATVRYWRDHNHCGATEYGADYADSQADGLTFERRLYLGGDSGSYVVFIRVCNGMHMWYADDGVYDISYAKEIVRFLRGELPSQMGVAETEALSCRLWPNPAAAQVEVQSAAEIRRLWLYDMQGRQVLTQAAQGTAAQIDVRRLPAGLYCLKVQTAQGCAMHKLTVRR